MNSKFVDDSFLVGGEVKHRDINVRKILKGPGMGRYQQGIIIHNMP